MEHLRSTQDVTARNLVGGACKTKTPFEHLKQIKKEFPGSQAAKYTDKALEQYKTMQERAVIEQGIRDLESMPLLGQSAKDGVGINGIEPDAADASGVSQAARPVGRRRAANRSDTSGVASAGPPAMLIYGFPAIVLACAAVAALIVWRKKRSANL